jgi:hypothetical protein
MSPLVLRSWPVVQNDELPDDIILGELLGFDQEVRAWIGLFVSTDVALPNAKQSNQKTGSCENALHRRSR